jgi:hypothetical protein
VNKDRELPNVLVYVNHAEDSGALDLLEALTGYFHADDGTRHTTMKHISDERLGHIKGRIDLYIWIDAKSRRATGWLYSESVPAHTELLRGLFQTSMQRVASRTGP